MEVVTKAVDSCKEGLEEVYVILMGALTEGTLSIKMTELCSRLLQEKGISARDNKCVFLYTMPNGIVTGDVKAIAMDWLSHEVFEKIVQLKEIDLYSVYKYFVNEIDKITAEIIEE